MLFESPDFRQGYSQQHRDVKVLPSPATISTAHTAATDKTTRMTGRANLRSLSCCVTLGVSASSIRIQMNQSHHAMRARLGDIFHLSRSSRHNELALCDPAQLLFIKRSIEYTSPFPTFAEPLDYEQLPHARTGAACRCWRRKWPRPIDMTSAVAWKAEKPRQSSRKASAAGLFEREQWMTAHRSPSTRLVHLDKRTLRSVAIKGLVTAIPLSFLASRCCHQAPPSCQ